MKEIAQLNIELKRYVDESAEKTEKITGAKIARLTKLSNNSRPNVRVLVSVLDDGMLELQYVYRDSLRLRDMGAGRGYSKGRPTSANSIRGRQPVRITNRPIHAQINRLIDLVDGAVMDYSVRELITPFDQKNSNGTK